MTSPHPIPFKEPPYLCGQPSAYYTPQLRAWQRACRDFMTTHFTPYAIEWEAQGEVPHDVFETFAKNKMLVPAMPAPLPVAELKAAGIHSILDVVKVEDFTAFHNLIYTDELMATGICGPACTINVSPGFGIPCLLRFGNGPLKQRFLSDLFWGRKKICMAVTEPEGGTDVANIRTRAHKTPDGQRYILDGKKMWISTAAWCSHAIVAVRTGEAGMSGISLIIVPLKNQEGVKVKRLSMAGQLSNGVAEIELNQVEVPIENLVGSEGQGMRYIMNNFNHERLTIAIGATRQARVVLSAAFEHCLQRRAFGRPLVDQPVVRNRLAKAGIQLEAQWAWIEQTVFQIVELTASGADGEIGALAAGLKANAGAVLKDCADCAVILFGGSAYSKDGAGSIAERAWREINGQRIPGGTEDILLDLMIRQLVKNATKGAGRSNL